MSESNAKVLAMNTVYLYLRMILVLLVTLYTSRVVLNVLGVDDFGIYNLVGGVVIFFGFLKTALTNASNRYLSFALGEGDKNKISNTYSMTINCHIVLAVALWFVMEVVGVWFLNTNLNIPEERMKAANWVFQFSLLTFCISIIQTPYHSNIIAHEKMSFYALISIVEVIIKLAIVYVLYLSPIDKLISYGILLFVASIIVFCAYAYYCRITFGDTIYKKHWDSKVAFQLMSYSGWSMLVNGADVSANQCISIFFNWFIGVVGNAALGISNQVNGGINMFVVNFSQAFYPQIIKSYASKQLDRFYTLIYSTTKIAFILYLVIAIPIAFNIEYILHIWLGEYPDITPNLIRATMLFYLFDCYQAPLWQAVHATGNLRTHQIMIGCIKIMAIPSAYITFKLGGSGALVLTVWAGLNCCCAMVRTIYMKRLINLNLRQYFASLIRLLVMAFISMSVAYVIVETIENSVLALLISSIVTFISITMSSMLIVLNKEERKLLHYIPIIGNFFK